MAKQLPPGPRGHFLTGVVREFSEDTLGFMLRLPAYGEFVSYRFGPFLAYSANHPDLFHQVLVTDADKFSKDRVTRGVLSETVGNGLLLSEGDFWKRQRKLVQPAFHSKRIGAYADIIAVANDPLQDISELKKVKFVKFVMKSGSVFKDELHGAPSTGVAK